MKKLLTYLLVAVLCISCLAACSKKNDDKNDSKQNDSSVTVVDDKTNVDDKTDDTQAGDAQVDDTTSKDNEDAEGDASVSDDTTDVTDTEEEDGEEDEEDDAPVVDLEGAKDYLFAMYKDKQGTTASDYERVSVLNINDVLYNVEWSVDVASGVTVVPGSPFTTIDVNEQTSEAINYVLTATIKDPDGNSITQEFTHDIPAYKETSWAEYASAADNTTVIVTGVVTGIISKSNGNSSNGLYFQDKDGGYYAYNLGSDPVTDGIKEGMTIKVTGQKSLYSGTYEIINSKVEIVDSSIKKATPADWTKKFESAENLKDEKLVKEQAFLVTVKGVEITGQDTGSGYYKFKLGDLESYIRISSSVCPIVKEKDAFIAGHSEHTGWIANATGIICVYDGAFYLTPITVDAFEYISLPTKSDAEMAAFEAENFSIASKFTQAATVELPSAGASYSDVAITWASSDEAVAAIADGVLTINVPKTDAKVTLTGTFKAGSETVTKEFTFVVEAPADDMCEAEVIAKAFALADGEAMNGKQVLRGEITEINTAYDANYGNITVTIKVGENSIQCYRLIGGEDLAVGDVITVTGNIKNYKGTVEFDAKCTYSKDLSVDEAKQLVVCEKAFALEENGAMNGKQVLRGEITEINTAYDANYGNITVTIKVGDYSIQCYRLIGGEDLAVGDVITVTGNLKNYKGTIEFDAKCTYVKDQTIAQAKQLVVCEKAFALEEGGAMNGLQVLTGEIVEIPTAYDEKYGNVTVNIKVGDYTIQCYRLIGGADLAVGDVITVTGNIKNYKGTVEFDAKCTYTK